MNSRNYFFKAAGEVCHRSISLILCIAIFWSTSPLAFAKPFQAPQPTADEKISNDQLDSLVAPIALYPDPLLSQILVASTYPLEIVQLSQWMQKNNKVTKEKLIEDVKNQDWDPSVQALVILPDLVKNLGDNIKWTADIGNAFLAQQSDVMDAVQRMRIKAKDSGKLTTTQQQKVETKVVEKKTIVVIEPSSPDVVYVPSYDPAYVWGAPMYPYPAYYYPPAGYYAGGMALSFGVGMMVGAAWGGGWGWGAGWGGNNNVYVNHNNSFVNNSNRKNFQGGDRNRNQIQPTGGRNNWQHNPQHRGGAPYSNRATAKQYGGTARGDSLANRQAAAKQNPSNFGSRTQSGASNRMAGRGGSTSGFGSSRAGGDRIGNQSLSNGYGSRSGGTFGSGGSSRASSTASSSRGSYSMGGSRGGGGGMRGGGGGRRR